jgi:hypothetical protein
MTRPLLLAAAAAAAAAALAAALAPSASAFAFSPVPGTRGAGVPAALARGKQQLRRPSIAPLQMGVGNTFGRIFRISTWGESHGGGVGVVLDGCPPKVPLTREDVQIGTWTGGDGLFFTLSFHSQLRCD